VSTNEKKQNFSKGICGRHVTHFWNCWTPNISETVEIRNFKKAQKGHMGTRDPIQNFVTPNTSGTHEARNFKFGTEMDGIAY